MNKSDKNFQTDHVMKYAKIEIPNLRQEQEEIFQRKNQKYDHRNVKKPCTHQKREKEKNENESTSRS